MGAYLSSPNTEKDLEDSDAYGVSYGAASMQGWRTSQEDAHNCCPDFDTETSTTLFAVYDGHGGAEVAQYCAIHLPEFIKSTKAYTDGDFGAALKDSFLNIDAKLTDANVVAELKLLAGIEDGDEPDGDDGDEIAQLKLEATMPIAELMKRYSRDKKEQKDSVDAGTAAEADEKKTHLLSPLVRGRLANGHGLLSGKLAGASRLDDVTSATNGSQGGSAATSELPATADEEDDVFMKSKAQAELMTDRSADAAAPLSVGSGAATDSPTPSRVTASTSSATTADDDAGCSSSTADTATASRNTFAGECDSSSEVDAGSCLGPSKNWQPSAADDATLVSADGGGSSSHEAAAANSEDSSVCSSSRRPTTDQVLLPPVCPAADSDSLPSSSGMNNTEDAEGPACSSSSGYKPLVDDGSNSDDSDEEEEEEDDDEEDAERKPWDDDDDEEDDGDEDDDEEMEEANDNDDDEDEESGSLLRKHVVLARPPGDDDEAPGAESGCTACVALIRGKTDIFVANAGDSRCVLSCAGRAVDLSCDHKPDDADETARIQRAGGHITPDGRVNGGLNLSRAIGDHAYKRNRELPLAEQMISALPDIVHHKISVDDEFLVVACDGIWNSMSSQEVVDFIRERLAKNTLKLSEICSELFNACLADDTLGDGTGCDNMTCIIVKLPHGGSGSGDGPHQQVAAKRPSSDRDDADGSSSTLPHSKRPRFAAFDEEAQSS